MGKRVTGEKVDLDGGYDYDSVEDGGWLWCIDCNRAYKKGMFRRFSVCWHELDLSYFKGKDYKNEKEFEDLYLPEKLCPYSDCEGSVTSSLAWKFVKECRKEYPEEPELNKRYSL